MGWPFWSAFRPLDAFSRTLGCVTLDMARDASPSQGATCMSTADTALLVVDAQESFRHRPYWTDRDVPLFLERLQMLVDGAKARGIPVVQIFHVEDDGPFALASGHVVT